jgi:hypothetical protein
MEAKDCGLVWIDGKQYYFTAWRKARGLRSRSRLNERVYVTLRGRDMLISKDKIKRWPIDQ